MENTISKRIKLLITELNLSMYGFAKNVGISQQSLSNYINGRVPPANIVEKILNKYRNVNSDWLISGEGEMFKPERKPEPKRYGADYIAKIEKELAEPKKNIIPFYDSVRTRGGNNDRSEDVIEAHSVPTEYIDAGGWFGDKITQAIRHYGDSMTEYPSGCILALREIYDIENVIWGKNYVIETNEVRVTKRIQTGKDENSIMAYSTNAETYSDGKLIHEPFRIKKKNIRKIFLVIGMISKEESSGIMKVIN